MSLYDGKYIHSTKQLQPVNGIYICPNENYYQVEDARTYHHKRIVELCQARLNRHYGISDKPIKSIAELLHYQIQSGNKRTGKSNIWFAVRNGCQCEMDPDCHEDCHDGAVYNYVYQYISREINAQYPLKPQYEKRRDKEKIMVNMPESLEHQVFDTKNPVHIYQLLGYMDAACLDVLEMLERESGMDPRLCKALQRLMDLINDTYLHDNFPHVNIQHLHLPECIDTHAPIAIGVYTADRSGRGPAKQSNWHVFTSVTDFVKQLYLAAYKWPRVWDRDNNLDWIFEADWVLALDYDDLVKEMLEHQMDKVVCPCGYLPLSQIPQDWEEQPKKVRKLYERHKDASWPYCMQCIPMDAKGQRSILPYFPPLKHKEPHARRMLQEQQQQQQVVQ